MLMMNGVGNWMPPLGKGCPGTLWDGPAHTVLIDHANMSIKLANPTANALNATLRIENPSFLSFGLRTSSFCLLSIFAHPFL
jgi:hypothetical protein